MVSTTTHGTGPRIITQQQAVLEEALIRARLRSLTVKNRTLPTVPKGTRNPYSYAVSLDGIEQYALRNRVVKPIPAQTAMMHLAARKSADRAEARHRQYLESHPASIQTSTYDITYRSLTPWPSSSGDAK